MSYIINMLCVYIYTTYIPKGILYRYLCNAEQPCEQQPHFPRVVSFILLRAAETRTRAYMQPQASLKGGPSESLPVALGSFRTILYITVTASHELLMAWGLARINDAFGNGKLN